MPSILPSSGIGYLPPPTTLIGGSPQTTFCGTIGDLPPDCLHPGVTIPQLVIIFGIYRRQRLDIQSNTSFIK